MSLIYGIHLMCWNVLELPDRPDHTAETETTAGIGTTKWVGARFALNAIVSVVSVSAVCDHVDQGDQVVPAHQVDNIHDFHELDPVHQADDNA